MATSDSTIPLPKVYIYALTDPFTGETRYIGKSIRPRERLTNQCNEKANTYRSHWIQSVLAKGQRPIQTILEELPGEADWQSAEKRWIAHGRAEGWPLTNGTDGGDGVPGLTGESKERLLKTWKGRKHKPESIEKIGAASRGRVQPREAVLRRNAKLKGREFTPEWCEKIARAVSKLTDEQVREIKLLLRDRVSQYVIAERFGVHQGTISNIKRGLCYAHVTIQDTELAMSQMSLLDYAEQQAEAVGE